MTEPDPLTTPAATAAADHEPENGAPSMPLLEAIDVRIALAGATALDELRLRTRGDRVLLAGDAAPLLATLFGSGVPGLSPAQDAGTVALEAQVVTGTLQVCGTVPGSAAYHSLVGLAPLDPPLPARWRVEQYLEWAARLSGAAKREARSLATAALARLGLEAGRSRRLGTLSIAERRAVVLAQAVVTSPRLLVAEAPLSHLEGPSLAWLAEVLRRCTDGLGTVLSVKELLPPAAESGLVSLATDVCYFRQGRLLVHASPSELLGGSHWMELCVAGGATAALERELRADGIELRGGPACLVAVVPPADPSAEPASSTPASRILAAAARAQAPVLRCVPVV